MNKVMFQKVLFLPIASLIILIISLAMADFILLPLMNAQIKKPHIFNWFFLIVIAGIALYKFIYWLIIIQKTNKKDSFVKNLGRAILTTGKKSVGNLFLSLFKLTILVFFVSFIVFALIFNNKLMF